jgi:hypothetical protein
MMDAGEVNTEGRISKSWREYSVLNKVLKYDECGWSNFLPTRKHGKDK